MRLREIENCNAVNRNATEAEFRFATVQLDQYTLSEYCQQKRKSHTYLALDDRYMPGQMSLGIRYYTAESAEHSEIQSFIDRIINSDYPNKIRIGDKFAVLTFDINFASREIHMAGFTVPKTIVKIVVERNGDIGWIEFDDGDYYPRQTPAVYQGRPVGYAAYFKSEHAADQMLTMMSLMVPDGWESYNTAVTSRTVQRDTGQPAVQLLSKMQARFVEHAINHNKCRDCTNIRSISKCSIVAGPINPNGTCDYFESVDDAVRENWEIEVNRYIKILESK